MPLAVVGMSHEAPALPVTQPSRSLATGSIDTLRVNLPPLIIRAFGAHGQKADINRAYSNAKMRSSHSSC